jgi:glycosidase
MEGKDDPDNRRDFPGGFPGDPQSAFIASQRGAPEQRMWQWTHEWIKLRQEHSALRHGKLVDLFYDDDAYVYARQDSTEKVIVALNRSAAEKKIRIPVWSLSISEKARLVPLFGSKQLVSARSELSVPPRTAVAFKLE